MSPAVRRFSSGARATMVRRCARSFWLCCRLRPAAAARRPGRTGASAGRSGCGVGSRRRLHHGRAGRARLPQLVYRCSVASSAGQGVQRLSGRRAGWRHRPDLAAVPHRDVVEGLRRAAVRNPADGGMAEHRPDPPLHPRLCDPGAGPGRSPSRCIATRCSTSAPAAPPKAPTSFIRQSTWCRFGRSPARR